MAHISIDVGLGASAPPVVAGAAAGSGAASGRPGGLRARAPRPVFAAGSCDQTVGAGETASQARLHRITRAHALAPPLHGRCDRGNIGIGNISINGTDGRPAQSVTTGRPSRVGESGVERRPA